MKIVTILASILLISSALAQTPTPKPCIDAKLKEQIQKLTLDAIDSALMSHVINLFQVWLKDFSPEPLRAIKGMERGISAYQRARTNALNWNPPICGEKEPLQ